MALVLAAKAALEAGRVPLRPALLALLLDELAAFLRLTGRAGELHSALLPLLTFIGRRGPPDVRRVVNVTDLRRHGAVRAGACRAAPMAALRARPAALPRAGAPARESGRRAAAQASPCFTGPGRAAHGGGC